MHALLLLHPFPTRRSSDLHYGRVNVNTATASEIAEVLGLLPQEAEAIVKYRRDKEKFEDFEALSKTPGVAVEKLEDRKSTRLNSSHRTISYAVFCLKKKK